MTDMEKVITELKAYINYPEPLCGIVKDAIELLEEQKQALKREYMRGYDKAWDEIGRR